MDEGNGRQRPPSTPSATRSSPGAVFEGQAEDHHRPHAEAEGPGGRLHDGRNQGPRGPGGSFSEGCPIFERMVLSKYARSCLSICDAAARGPARRASLPARRTKILAALTSIFGCITLRWRKTSSKTVLAVHPSVRRRPEIPRRGSWLPRSIVPSMSCGAILPREPSLRTWPPHRKRMDAGSCSPYPLGPAAIQDDELRMMFSCHDLRSAEPAQIALILHILCGFSVGEVAAAFLRNNAAIEKRITRAKKSCRLEKTFRTFSGGFFYAFVGRTSNAHFSF